MISEVGPASNREDSPLTNDFARGIDRGLTSYGDAGFSRFLRRAFLASAGYDVTDLQRPVVGIADTSSEFTPCHRPMPGLVDAVRRGVLEAGGLPMVFPTASLGEVFLSPTSMMFRNLVAMETEELVRAQPLDAVVLLGGCDKTVPAQLMALASADIPALVTVVGPMLTGEWRGQRLGACTDCRLMWARHRAGDLDEQDIDSVRDALCQTGGTCMVMGTASTMACLTEALGLAVPGSATAPAASGDRLRVGVRSGRRAVAMAKAGTRPSSILTAGSFHNAITVLAALGGSTNAIIHLLAVAGRTATPLTLADFDRIACAVPLLVDCKPAGSSYMEDFHRSGGMPTLLKALTPLLNLDAATAAGTTLGEQLSGVETPQPWQRIIRTLDDPVGPSGSLAVLRGSLCPDGAVLKVAAASAHLLHHRGPAVVFDSPEEAVARLDDPQLKVTPEHVLVLRNAGPVASGMPEAGSLPIPRRLAAAGVKDMLRVSDARMSGTSYGTCVLHASPEAAIGGPLALVQSGDLIELDVDGRRLDLLVDNEELTRRRLAWRPGACRNERGFAALHAKHVQSAHLGADFDFLTAHDPHRRPALVDDGGPPG